MVPLPSFSEPVQTALALLAIPSSFGGEKSIGRPMLCRLPGLSNGRRDKTTVYALRTRRAAARRTSPLSHANLSPMLPNRPRAFDPDFATGNSQDLIAA